jgi:hypothetical protein
MEGENWLPFQRLSTDGKLPETVIEAVRVAAQVQKDKTN